MKPYLLLLFCLISMATRAQIIAPDTVCQYDTVTATTAFNAVTYTWIDSSFTANPGVSGTGINVSCSAYDGPHRILNDNGHWYAITSWNGGIYPLINDINLYDLGTDPNSPMTNPVSLSTNYNDYCFGLEVIKDDVSGNWYAFTSGNHRMYRFSFGTSLANTPTVDTFYTGNVAVMFQITIKKYDNEWVGFVSNGGTGLVRMDFGTSLTNSPSISALSVTANLRLDGGALYENGNYYMIGSVSNGTITSYVRLEFGSDIKNNSPVSVPIGAISGSSFMFMLISDCGKILGFLSDPYSYNIYYYDFGSSITNNTPVFNTVASNIELYNVPTSFIYNNTQYLSYHNNFRCTVNLPLFSYPAATPESYYRQTNKFVFNTPGLHTITLLCNEVVNGACGASFCKDVYVKPSPLGTLTNLHDTGVCPGVPIPLDASGYNGANYLWSNGATTPAITTTGAGNYWVKISGAPGCANGTDTIKVKSYPGAYANLGADTSACADSLATLQNVGFTGAGNYLWNTGETTQSIQAPPNNTYWLQVTTLDGCIKADTINVTVTPSPNIALTDTAICPEATVSLHANAQPAGSSYLWNTGSTSDNTTVSAGNDYWLEVTNARKCVSRDTVTVTARPSPNASLGTNFSVCADKTTMLQAPDSSNYTYLWNTGSITNNTEATPGTDYWVLVTDEYGCVNSDTVTIGTFALPVVNLGDDAGLCPEGKVLASPLTGSSYSYNWSTGETTATIKVYADNTYTLAVTDKNGCTGMDEISYTAVPVPEVQLGAKDTTVCNDRTLILPVYATNGNTYLWNDGSTEQTLSAYEQGVYTLSYSNQCYTIADTITVHHRNCSLWFPSAFTPNGDGKNDVARVLGDLAYVSEYHLTIYNRWGRQVYSTTDLNSGWDGSYKGTAQDIGTYNYLIRYTYKGHEQQLDGAITLIR
jgi:gliding motility-associated-like protein